MSAKWFAALVAATASVVSLAGCSKNIQKSLKLIAEDPGIRTRLVQTSLAEPRTAFEDFLRPMEALDREPLKAPYETLKAHPTQAVAALADLLRRQKDDISLHRVLFRLAARLARDGAAAAMDKDLAALAREFGEGEDLVHLEAVLMLSAVDQPESRKYLGERLDPVAMVCLGEHASIQSAQLLAGALKRDDVRTRSWALTVISYAWPKRPDAAELAKLLSELPGAEKAVTLAALAHFPSARHHFEKTETVELLGDVVRAEDPAQRGLAPFAIEALGDARTRPALQELLALMRTPESVDYRPLISDALAKHTGTEAMRLMTEALSTLEDEGRAAVVRAIAFACESGAGTVDAGRLILIFEDLVFRGGGRSPETALDGLTRWKAPQAQRLLLKIIREHSSEQLRGTALEAYRTQSPPTLREDLRQIASTNSSERIRALANRMLSELK